MYAIGQRETVSMRQSEQDKDVQNRVRDLAHLPAILRVDSSHSRQNYYRLLVATFSCHRLT